MARAGIGAADFALVFFTIDHLPRGQKLLTVLRHITKTDSIVGSSGAGVLTGAGEIEGSSGVAVLVVASDRVRAHPFLFRPLRDRDREVGREIARTVERGDQESSLLVLFPDSYNGQPHRFFEGLEEDGRFLPVVGAGSSEDGTQGKTYQLCEEQVTTDALSGLLLSGSFATSIEITQGCQPVTEPMVITKSRGNLIFEIDHDPAFKRFAQVVRGPLLEDLRRALAVVFVGLPADPHKNRVDAGEYLVRNIVGLDPEKGILAVGEPVFEGERMIFALRDSQRARDDLNQMLERQLKNLAGRRPQFGLYFNCCARGRSLYGISDIDTAYIRRFLGDFPLIGFFGNFELGPLGRRNQLLAYTGVLVLITEKG